ncbi:MAG: hypothetical protein R3C05_31380 [Pirellulaceae bacterium]
MSHPRVKSLLTTVLLSAVFVDHLDAQEVRLDDRCVVRFASQQEAADVLGTEDAFIERLTRFDLQSRLQTEREVTSLDYRTELIAGIQPWTESLKEQVLSPLRTLSERIVPLRLPLPEEILLVCTNGQGEAGAPHTRGNAIILPQKRISSSPDVMLRLLAHELFHVVSRHDATLRDALYREIGFHRCQEIEVPDEWKDRRITNPDAPIVEHFIEVAINDRVVPVAPILFSRIPVYNTRHSEPFFKYLDLRFVELKKTSEGCQVALDGEGKMISYAAKELPDFLDQVGTNTNYIIHPEEILADNFSFLISGKTVPSPEVIAAMNRVFRDQLSRQGTQ